MEIRRAAYRRTTGVRANLRRTAPLAGLGVAAIMIAAAAPWSAADAADTNIAIVDFAFSPSSVSISAGDRVTWRNTGFAGHTTTSLSGVWNSGVLVTDGQFSHAFALPGTYEYRCQIHASMTGTVIVGEGPGPAPSPSPNPSVAPSASVSPSPSPGPSTSPSPSVSPSSSPSPSATPTQGVRARAPMLAREP